MIYQRKTRLIYEKEVDYAEKQELFGQKKNKFCLKNRICLQKHSLPETVWRNGLICLSTPFCTFLKLFLAKPKIDRTKMRPN